MFEYERIEKLIKKHRINAKALAEAIGVSPGNITDWKTGKSKPSSDAIMKIAQYFEVTADYLLGITSKPNRMAAPPELAEYGYEWIPLVKKARASGLTPEQVEKLIDAVKDIGK